MIKKFNTVGTNFKAWSIMKYLQGTLSSLLITIILIIANDLYADDDAGFCWSCLGYSPFYESKLGEREHSFGLEINVWMPEVVPNTADYDAHGVQQGPNRLKTPINGFGLRYVERGLFERQYISPYLLSSIALITGVSIGPEIGISNKKLDYGLSGRAWLSLFGFECNWTKRSDFSIMLYTFIPFLDFSI